MAKREEEDIQTQLIQMGFPDAAQYFEDRAQPTRGPWTAVRGSDRWAVTSHGKDHVDFSLEANARLAAAAPAMLEALEIFMNRVIFHDTYVEVRFDDSDGDMIKILRAIGKARGDNL